MARTTLKKVNKALDDKFGAGKLELVKGKGYFYFVGPLSSQMVEQGIYTYSINDISVDNIVRTAETKIKFWNS